MKYRSGNEVRQLFLDYFKSKGHMVEPGASLVPVNDPTLLWINSGVAALKKYFDGSVKPDNKRITNAQKSIRTNDIENVGKTARHHTFFEMLGNFSIGDYFKEEALQFAWEFLTSEEYIGMEKDKMYVTIHPTDDEAYRIWTEVIGLDPKRILKSEENYWQIGEGPCGPNSEIYYDRGLAYDPENIGEPLFFEERENDRYLEVWIRGPTRRQAPGVAGGDDSSPVPRDVPQLRQHRPQAGGRDPFAADDLAAHRSRGTRQRQRPSVLDDDDDAEAGRWELSGDQLQVVLAQQSEWCHQQRSPSDRRRQLTDARLASRVAVHDGPVEHDGRTGRGERLHRLEDAVDRLLGRHDDDQVLDEMSV